MYRKYSTVLIISILSFVILKAVLAWYSTKTAYIDSFNAEQMEFINRPENYKLEGCIPEQVYIFLRHGSRFPSEKQIVKSNEFLKQAREYRKSKSKNKPSLIDEIKLTFDDKPEYALSDLGKQEMHSIAQRFAKRYPNLFDKEEIAQGIREAKPLLNTQSSSKERSIDSAKSFLHGLFSSKIELDKTYSIDSKYNQTLKHLIENIKINDRMLRLFSECFRYQIGIENNYTATSELYKFKMGHEMTKLVENFKKRHYLDEMNVEASMLIKLFTLCNIETAHKMPENWCKLFIPEDYETFAYYNDLKGYLKKSYGYDLGYEINSRMAFLILKDVFEEMENYIKDNSNKKKVLLRFGHAENMFPLVTALSLFKDSTLLKADNFIQNLNRKFKSGILTPFSANLAFVLHRCHKDNEKKSIYDEYKINILINELPISKLTNGGELLCASKFKNDPKYEINDSICYFKDLEEQLKSYIELEYEKVCNISSKDKHIKVSRAVKENVAEKLADLEKEFKIEL